MREDVVQTEYYLCDFPSAEFAEEDVTRRMQEMHGPNLLFFEVVDKGTLTERNPYTNKPDRQFREFIKYKVLFQL